jgi:hypothetical protein
VNPDDFGLEDGRQDTIMLHNGTWMRTHGISVCFGKNCCIHNPSNHPLKDAPLYWLRDLGLMFRMCEHDSIHPDPDALDFHQMLAFIGRADFYDGYHPCCDSHCCNEASVNE